MPFKKTRLVLAERAKYLECALELQSGGLDVEIPEEWLEHSRELEIIVAPPSENILCELPSGITACAVQVNLIALRGNLILKDFVVASEWDADLMPLSSDGRGLYGVGSAFEFAEGEVLNRRLEAGLHFRRRGDTAEGWVVAAGYTPLPERYLDRIMTELTLTFTDQFGKVYPERANVILERSSRRKKWLHGLRSQPPIGLRQDAPGARRKSEVDDDRFLSPL
jgi:hypothetical protein